jgi:hypothetical protein
MSTSTVRLWNELRADEEQWRITRTLRRIVTTYKSSDGVAGGPPSVEVLVDPAASWDDSATLFRIVSNSEEENQGHVELIDCQPELPRGTESPAYVYQVRSKADASRFHAWPFSIIQVKISRQGLAFAPLELPRRSYLVGHLTRLSERY